MADAAPLTGGVDARSISWPPRLCRANGGTAPSTVRFAAITRAPREWMNARDAPAASGRDGGPTPKGLVTSAQVTLQQQRAPKWSGSAGIAIGSMLLAGLAGIIVSILVYQPLGDMASESAFQTPEPTPTVTIEPFGRPADDVAGSSGFIEDFDMIPIGADVDGWSLSNSASFHVTALPSAFDRSGRLAADRGGTACKRIDVAIASVTANFMLNPLPAESVPVLILELDNESALSLAINSDGARLTDSSAPVPIEPRAWYRWVVVAGDSRNRITLLSADNTILAEASVPWPGPHAKRFCLTTVGPAGLYLDTLTAEAQ